ncbi:complement factor I isoform X2 [Alligator mississippiensis]|uniref:complement factor I isoform X2 n=1 Tax=Alligator mississippiensis TaxID=8496 RepID=UPI0006EC65FD|nr:complement factor I isoform X2 [Alligator mississippiensis]
MKLLLLLGFSCVFFCTYGGKVFQNQTSEYNKEPVQQVQPTHKETHLVGECLKEKYTQDSCEKVFCLPWKRCVSGNCICKLPYQCPKNGTSVSSINGKTFRTYCQLKSYECQRPEAKYMSKGDCIHGEKFDVSLNYGDSESEGVIQVKLVNNTEKLFLCNSKWSMNEANVACRHRGFEAGAEYHRKTFTVPEHNNTSSWCLQVICRGEETSLAECKLIKRSPPGGVKNFATVACHKFQRECTPQEYCCANKKCIPLTETCNGINDCGDLSDELCCKECKNKSFLCNSGVCIPKKYLCNKEVDCLTGEDELQVNCEDEQNVELETQDQDDEGQNPETETQGQQSGEQSPEPDVQGNKEADHKVIIRTRAKGKAQEVIPNYNADEERRAIKTFLPELKCGITNHTVTRCKRIVGGNPAAKGEFPWQVAIKEEGGTGPSVYCGGVYIGGCWILTAAHCVRATRVHQYRIWSGLLDTIQYNREIDTFKLNKVIIHEKYNAGTYENDIALLEMKSMDKGKPCSLAYSTPACVPWSEYMFKPGHRCKISGWGLERDSAKQFVLKWGYIDILSNCTEIYKDRFFKGMECAGTHDGSIDSCKGDSGGPLICFDSNNVAYVWGVVSWGENCGVAGYPGVYTKVASYFDWISHQVGRALISKYNV